MTEELRGHGGLARWAWLNSQVGKSEQTTGCGSTNKWVGLN